MGAKAIPEGFVSNKQTTLVFQNPKRWADAEVEGLMVQGNFLGLTEKDAYGKENFKFEATADGVSFDADGNTVEYKAGTTVIINTSAGLSNQMNEIDIGTEVAIIYNGQTKISKGPYKGKMAHNYTVATRG